MSNPNYHFDDKSVFKTLDKMAQTIESIPETTYLEKINYQNELFAGSLASQSNQSTGLETPTRVISSSNKNTLTPGPILVGANTWAHATIRKQKNESNDSDRPRDKKDRLNVNKFLDFAHDAPESPMDNGIRLISVSPIDKIRESPDFESMVSQILGKNRNDPEKQAILNPPASEWKPTSTYDINHTNASSATDSNQSIDVVMKNLATTITFSAFEPVTSLNSSKTHSAASSLSISDNRNFDQYRSSNPNLYDKPLTQYSESYGAYSTATDFRRTHSNDFAYDSNDTNRTIIYESNSSIPSSILTSLGRNSGNIDLTGSSNGLPLPKRSDSDPSYHLPQHYLQQQTNRSSMSSASSTSSVWSGNSSMGPSSQPYPQSIVRRTFPYDASEYNSSNMEMKSAHNSLDNSNLFRGPVSNQIKLEEKIATENEKFDFGRLDLANVNDYPANIAYRLQSAASTSHMNGLNRPAASYNETNASYEDYSHRGYYPPQQEYDPRYGKIEPSQHNIASISRSNIYEDSPNHVSSSAFVPNAKNMPISRQMSQSLPIQSKPMTLHHSNSIPQASQTHSMPSNIPSLQQLQNSGYNPAQRRLTPNIATVSKSLQQQPMQSILPYGNPTAVSNTLHRSHDSLISRSKANNSMDGFAPKISTSPTSSMSFIKPQQHSQQELIESPRTKNLYKEFYKVYRNKERESLDSAKAYVVEALTWIPDKSRWKIYLELAEIAKRNNEFDEARQLYEKVTRLQPLASQGWLEWSKMEEEYGCFEKSLQILLDGLKYCQYNEGLLTKAVKQHERKDDYELARQMLSSLRSEPIDRVWRSILEGALFEVRTGEFVAARKIFQFLMQNVSWYGPIYYEAYRLDEKESQFQSALKIIEKGLTELPRYGPLWFGLLKIMERYDMENEERKWLIGAKPKLKNLRLKITNAVRNISPELIWKIYFEQAQAEERAADYASYGLCCTRLITIPSTGLGIYSNYFNLNDNLSSRISSIRNKLYSPSRKSFIRSLLVCPNNLKWKIWLAGCRLELSAGNVITSRQLLCFAFASVPIKSKSYVYLEASRVEEYSGNILAARNILRIAREEISSEWKLFLEAVLLEARAGNMIQAIQLAEISLKQHSGTGRLWSVLIQLCHRLETILPIRQQDLRHFSRQNFNLLSTHDEISSNESNHPTSSTTTTSDEEFDDEIYGILSSSPSIHELTLSNKIKSINSKESTYKIPNKFIILSKAIKHVPKSGEVWCEGARCLLNPMNVTTFDLSKAQRYLQFAIQFTPQYGDAFIEYLRLEMISQVILPCILNALSIPIKAFIQRVFQCDSDADILEWIQGQSNGQFETKESQPHQQRRQILIALEKMTTQQGKPGGMNGNIFPSDSEMLQRFQNIAMKKLSRRCSNADPNYGTLWFHCRLRPFDSSADVLHHAAFILAHELVGCYPIYARAILHYVEKCCRGIVLDVLQSIEQYPDVELWLQRAHGDDIHDTSTQITDSSSNLSLNEKEFHQYVLFLKDYDISRRLMEDYRNTWNYRRNLSIVDCDQSIYIATDFVSGIIDLNRLLYKKRISDEDRRKILFGFDQILS